MMKADDAAQEPEGLSSRALIDGSYPTKSP
jgi:hypothetical protein